MNPSAVALSNIYTAFKNFTLFYQEHEKILIRKDSLDRRRSFSNVLHTFGYILPFIGIGIYLYFILFFFVMRYAVVN